MSVESNIYICIDVPLGCLVVASKAVTNTMYYILENYKYDRFVSAISCTVAIHRDRMRKEKIGREK